MLSTLFALLFIFLIMIGTVAICYGIMLKLLLPKSKKDYFVILPFDRNSSNVRKTAYGMRIKLCLFGDGYKSRVVALDNGMNDDEREDLRKICTEANGIYLVEKDRIRDFFNGRI